MNKYRCKVCNKVLFEANYIGIIIKKCPKCKSINTFEEKTKEKNCNSH